VPTDPPTRRCLLSVHAHPDDESSKGASTVAAYHARGVRTVLVCCTGGEEGEVLNPALQGHPAVLERLAEVRMEELAAAAAIIGYDEVVLLGYRDSGMPGAPSNDDPRSFAQAPFEEAVERLVAVIRSERPQVILSYPDGQHDYPHPDHLRVHEISVAAFDAAGDPDRFPRAGAPFEPLKLYFNVWPVARYRAIHAKYVELGIESPFSDQWLERFDRPDIATTYIDIAEFDHIRADALRAHATQVDPTSTFWFGLDPEIQRTVSPYDTFVLAQSRVAPLEGPEDDLFAGVDVRTGAST
jgi:mycothiol S-conjugate amidase